MQILGEHVVHLEKPPVERHVEAPGELRVLDAGLVLQDEGGPAQQQPAQDAEERLLQQVRGGLEHHRVLGHPSQPGAGRRAALEVPIRQIHADVVHLDPAAALAVHEHEPHRAPVLARAGQRRKGQQAGPVGAQGDREQGVHPVVAALRQRQQHAGDALHHPAVIELVGELPREKEAPRREPLEALAKQPQQTPELPQGGAPGIGRPSRLLQGDQHHTVHPRKQPQGGDQIGPTEGIEQRRSPVGGELLAGPALHGRAHLPFVTGPLAGHVLAIGTKQLLTLGW